MEKRSRRRIRDLVAPAAFQGLSQNEIGCARISMMARSTNPPFKGRIQKRKTNHLQIITFRLQRAAGPYSRVNVVDFVVSAICPVRGQSRKSRGDTAGVGTSVIEALRAKKHALRREGLLAKQAA